MKNTVMGIKKARKYFDFPPHSFAQLSPFKLLLAPGVDPSHAVLSEYLRVAYLTVQLNYHLLAFHSLWIEKKEGDIRLTIKKRKCNQRSSLLYSEGQTKTKANRSSYRNGAVSSRLGAHQHNRSFFLGHRRQVQVAIV